MTIRLCQRIFACVLGFTSHALSGCVAGHVGNDDGHSTLRGISDEGHSYESDAKQWTGRLATRDSNDPYDTVDNEPYVSERHATANVAAVVASIGEDGKYTLSAYTSRADLDKLRASKEQALAVGEMSAGTRPTSHVGNPKNDVALCRESVGYAIQGFSHCDDRYYIWTAVSYVDDYWNDEYESVWIAPWTAVWLYEDADYWGTITIIENRAWNWGAWSNLGGASNRTSSVWVQRL